MEPYLFRQMMEVEKSHWWFVGRRKIIDWALGRFQLSEDSTILEVGCGTGGNLELLAHYGNVKAMESDIAALEIARQRADVNIKHGWLPDHIPFEQTKFDLIVLLDVLEHVPDDGAALHALREKLRPGGKILITVPAFGFLWSKHDDLHHHYRRYSKPELMGLLRMSGYRVRYASYFNSILFPVIAAVRLFNRLSRNETTDDVKKPSYLINRILCTLFGAERYLLGEFSLPFGVSLLLMAELGPNPGDGILCDCRGVAS